MADPVRLSEIGTATPEAVEIADQIDTAALAGGLIVNDIYKTATGELRIVV